MKLNIKFTEKEMEPVEIDINSESNIYEIEIDGTNKSSSIVYYMQTMSYLFGCIENQATEKIDEISIEDIPFADKIVKGSALHTSYEENYNSRKTVIYDIANNNIVEHKYMYNEEGISEQTINKSVINSMPTSDISLGVLNYIVETHFPEYKLEVVKRTGKIDIKNKKGRRVDVSNLKGQDWLFFQLMMLFLTRGEHNGVFYINCKGLTNNTVIGIILLVRLFFVENKIVFLYNKGEQNIPSIPLRLPSL